MLWITDDNNLNTQISKIKIKDVSSSIIDGNISGNTKNLLTIVNSAKFKKSDLIKSRMSNLSISETDVLIPRTKKAFIYL